MARQAPTPEEEPPAVEAVASTSAGPGAVTWLIGAISCVGLFDALLLTIEHYTKRNLPCTVTHGCETVLTSKYATVGPIPTAALGLIFYGVVLFAVVYALTNRTRLPRQLLLAWTALGFLSSLGLTYLQAFVIHAWCQYCLLSGLSSTLLFALAAYNYTRKEV